MDSLRRTHFDSGWVVIPELNERKSDEEKDDVEGKESPGVVDRKLAEGGGRVVVLCVVSRKKSRQWRRANALLTKSCRHPSHLKIVMVLGLFPASLFFQPSRRSTGQDRTGPE